MVQQLPLLTSCSIAGAIALLSVQPAWAEMNQVTDVTVNPAKEGIEVILQTTNPKLSKVVTSTYEKTYIAELTNTQLRLESGKPFNVSNPANGIASVTVTSLNPNSVRIVVTGIDSPPAVKIEQSDGNLVLTVAAPSQTSASSETQEPTTTEEREPDIELTVTADRRTTPLRETPATVDIKTQEELEREEPIPRTVGEQLQTLPGIVINRLGLLSGSANIRGLTGERIGVLVDGERLPNLEFGPDLGSVDPFRVERLEVLKGPASSIYGADAFGGVINIITTTPKADAPFGVRAFAFGGGFAEYGGNLEITGPNFVIGTSRKVAGDAKDGGGDLIPPQGTEYKVFDIYGTGRIDLSTRDRLELRFDRYRQDNADLNGFPFPPFIEAKNVFRDRERYSLAYVNEGVEGGTNFSLRGYYQKSFRRFENTTQVSVVLSYIAC
ncbi:TonB-dependent receptor plug domain-containing protein [Scytonema sp. NUACC26]|uniref:TonB-dependent receptor plug domain-containing protein n=1 Tax=Scytonema sp. NUACC26 TaxID=3140176 RepID=UPI0038B3071A